MRIVRPFHRSTRRGTVLPMLAVCLIGLCGFTALAIDLGMLAVSRTECQNAADIASLVGCRTLNNKPTAINNDLALAVTNAKATAVTNTLQGNNIVASQIQKVETGQFLYNAAAQKFQVSTWTDVTNSQSTLPSNGSWTGIRVTIAVAQPTYFMKVFGINSMPSGAVASAVYRPRDTAFVLDMTGSMGYASTFNFNGASQNPDTAVPIFGHYVGTQANLISTTNQANGNGEAISRNNFTITTPGGFPIVRDFYFDSSNASNPTTSAYPVVPANLKNAFHWNPPESGGNATTYTPSTYTFTGYNAFDTTRAKGPTPAPDNFKSMTDASGLTYVGDRWRRYDGSINKIDTTWATGSSPNWASTKAAASAIELLGYKGTTTVQTGGGTNIVANTTFRDLVWEQNGYDLDIVKYRSISPTGKGTGTALTPTPASTLAAGWPASQQVASGTYAVPLLTGTRGTAGCDLFQGYSMGPGYWGKSFFIWPPDPRWGGTATAVDPTSPTTSGAYVGVKDTNGNWICDWRRRFFLNRAGTAFDPQADNNTTTSGSGNNDSIDRVLMNQSSGLTVSAIGSTGTPNWKINYSAVLKWIKGGPQTLPPNLRAGRVLYYSSIPDNVTTSGSTQVDLDKVFWKNYIDYVIGWNWTSNANLYGLGDSWSGGALSISTADTVVWTGPSSSWPSVKPYMAYSDMPNRPRLHMWFGPLSMMDYLGWAANTSSTTLSGNWNPGTCHEAQCWQLKAGMNSVIDDVRNNRPNDYVGMAMFAADAYNGPRVAIGQNYQSLKDALFYPKTLLSLIDAGDTTTEIRPHDINFTSLAGDNIPNANGSTDPNTGLTYAFNILSPSTLTSTNQAYASPQGYGTLKGRRGASKVVIFETDGVPNTYRGLSSGTHTMNPTLKGYDTYYPVSAWSSGNIGNGVQPCMSEALKVVQQIVKPMATQGNAQGSTADSGLSLPNAPARVYAVGFGDIFDPVASPGATFRPTALQFLADVAYNGNTGVQGATQPPSYQIITGPYDTRISNLRDCMERIFETGVSVALVE